MELVFIRLSGFLLSLHHSLHHIFLHYEIEVCGTMHKCLLSFIFGQIYSDETARTVASLDALNIAIFGIMQHIELDDSSDMHLWVQMNVEKLVLFCLKTAKDPSMYIKKSGMLLMATVGAKKLFYFSVFVQKNGYVLFFWDNV